jgi:FSR family fosmidomycin resistance protein-like MFS transporter
MIGGTLGSSLGPKLGAFLVQSYTIRATPWLMPLGVSLAVLMAVVLPANRRRTIRPSETSFLKGLAGIPRPVFLVMVVGVSQGWLEMGLQSYYPMLMTGRGESLGRAATVLMLFSLFGAVGAFLGGTLSDRLPRWTVLAMGVAGAAPLYLGMLLLRGPWLLVMPAAFGVAAAISHPVTVAMAQELMPDRVALASSLCMGISWVIGSLGAMLTGLLADHIGMQSALLLNAALPLVGLVSIALLRRLAVRQAAAAHFASTGGYAEFPEA